MKLWNNKNHNLGCKFKQQNLAKTLVSQIFDQLVSHEKTYSKINEITQNNV